MQYIPSSLCFILRNFTHHANAFFIDYEYILLTCTLVISNCPMLTVKTLEQRLIPHFGAFTVNLG